MNLDIFYHGETGQPLNEWGPVAMNSELVHQYLMKYKFTKPFHLLVNELDNMEIN